MVAYMVWVSVVLVLVLYATHGQYNLGLDDTCKNGDVNCFMKKLSDVKKLVKELEFHSVDVGKYKDSVAELESQILHRQGQVDHLGVGPPGLANMEDPEWAGPTPRKIAKMRKEPPSNIENLTDLRGKAVKNTLFYISFMGNYLDSSRRNKNTLIITSAFNTKVNVVCKYLNYNKTYPITAGKPLEIKDIPKAARVIDNKKIQQKAIKIQANHPVSIQGLISQAGDSFLALSPLKESTSFFIPSFNGNMYWPSGFVIVSTKNNTQVTISSPGSEDIGATSHSIRLQDMDTYGYFLPAQGDPTGYHIKSTKPIVVFSGSRCARVPNDIPYCELITTCVSPVPLLGLHYIIPPIPKRNPLVGYTLRIIATEDDTYVSLSSNVELDEMSLDKGEFEEWDMMPSDECFTVECTSPCMVIQYNKGFKAEQNPKLHTNPYMLSITPMESLKYHATFATFNWYHSYLVIISAKLSTPDLLLDGERLHQEWTYVARLEGSAFVYTTLKLGEGFHVLEDEKAKRGTFLAYVVGYQYFSNSAHAFPVT